MKRQRADLALVERGLAESRTRAQALIMAGLVSTDDARIDKPGQLIEPDAALAVKGRDHPWVGRGGLKLDHGLSHFGIGVTGITALDVGSSTGGFTDVLLARGAAKVYAVDVGTNQLAWKLRQDPRVIVLEQTDARRLDRTLIVQEPSVVVCDASFIGLKQVLPVPLSLAAADATLVALIKPQFEVGRAEVGKGGIVSDPALHDAVQQDIALWLDGIDWTVLGVTPSPILGTEGNREFLIAAKLR